MDRFYKAIEEAGKTLPSIECKVDELMKNHTTLKIGGAVRGLFLPKKTEELLALCRLLRDNGITPFVFGNGSNLLVDDRGALEMIAIKTSGIDEVTLTAPNEITAAAGATMAKLAVFALNHELSGLECAAGIPGTLGGAVLMNAGAYGMEIKDVVRSTIGMKNCEMFSLTGEEHEFSYRHSRFTDSGEIVLSSVLRLEKGDKVSIRAKMQELALRRSESQPLDLPSAGSAFKRPKEGYAAAMIDQAGLKGFAIGDAQVSAKHAGFIVNTGSAKFSDVMALIEHVQAVVYKQFAVELEPEYKIIPEYKTIPEYKIMPENRTIKE